MVIKNKTLFAAAIIGYFVCFFFFCIYPGFSILLGAVSMFLLNIVVLTQTTLDNDSLAKWIIIGLPITICLIATAFGIKTSLEGTFDFVGVILPTCGFLFVVIGIPTLIAASAMRAGVKFN